MPDNDRTVVGPLDPSHYVEHVTRTALLLEQLARDVKALREQTEASVRDTGGLRSALSQLEKHCAVFETDAVSRMEVNRVCITDLTERLRWLNRLVIGAVVSGLISGLVALIYGLTSS